MYCSLYRTGRLLSHKETNPGWGCIANLSDTNAVFTLDYFGVNWDSADFSHHFTSSVNSSTNFPLSYFPPSPMVTFIGQPLPHKKTKKSIFVKIISPVRMVSWDNSTGELWRQPTVWDHTTQAQDVCTVHFFSVAWFFHWLHSNFPLLYIISRFIFLSQLWQQLLIQLEVLTFYWSYQCIIPRSEGKHRLYVLVMQSALISCYAAGSVTLMVSVKFSQVKSQNAKQQ